MNREQLWAQYAAAALSGMLANEYSSRAEAIASDVDLAARHADAMLAEHLHRFPQDQQEAASWEQQEGFEWMTVSGRKIPSWPNAQEAQQPDADGWIKWEGGECPVGEGAFVDVQLRDGEIFQRIYGRALYWKQNHGGLWRGGDIIAYRLSR